MFLSQKKEDYFKAPLKMYCYWRKKRKKASTCWKRAIWLQKLDQQSFKSLNYRVTWWLPNCNRLYSSLPYYIFPPSSKSGANQGQHTPPGLFHSIGWPAARQSTSFRFTVRTLRAYLSEMLHTAHVSIFFGGGGGGGRRVPNRNCQGWKII